MADYDGKVPNGDQTRNNRTKALNSAKNVLNDKSLPLRLFPDAKAALDAKLKAVNDAVSAKAQAGAQAAQDAARTQAAAGASSNAGGGYSTPARRCGNGCRTPPITAAATIVYLPAEVTHQPLRAVTAVIPPGKVLLMAPYY